MFEVRSSADVGALWDPLASSFRSNPYPALRRLRAVDPIHHTADDVVLTRHEDVASTLRDPAFGMSPRDELVAALRERLGSGRAFDYVSRRLSNYNPPDHTRLRSLVVRAFTPRRVEQLRPWVENVAARLLDDVSVGSEFDVIAVLAHPLPSLVICEMLGVPDADRSAFDRWTSAIAHLIGPYVPSDRLAAGEAAVAQEWACIESLIEERRRQPGKDLLSALLGVEEDGERLEVDEVIAMVIFLFSAGHQTTRDLIGNGLLGLFAHPHELRHLADDPTLGPEAVEECLRYDGPVPFISRSAHVSTMIRDEPIHAGQRIVCVLAAANRDPERYPDPDAFRIERPERQAVAFGGGIHHCLGAALARIEAETILRVLVQRFPKLRLASDDIAWRDTIVFRGPVAVPVAT
jgi:pimeloyl-[acyl-carrier protein] synthase